MATGWPYRGSIPDNVTYYEAAIRQHYKWPEWRETLVNYGFTSVSTTFGKPGIFTVENVKWIPPKNYRWHLVLYKMRLKKRA